MVNISVYFAKYCLLYKEIYFYRNLALQMVQLVHFAKFPFAIDLHPIVLFKNVFAMVFCQ